MQKLKQQQSIRLANTLLAASGGGILSLTLIYAYYVDALLVPSYFLWIFFAVFWLGSATFIGVVASGANLRFRDPALSLPQMYWAVSSSILALMYSSRLDIAIYLLLLLILVFGIFRITLREFNFITLFVILSLFATHVVRLLVIEPQAEYSLVMMQWLTFTFCAIALTHICRSILTLRNRLREKNEELLAALETKQQFLANMSHEIRTPMNGVLGMLDIVMREELPLKQRRYLSVAQSSARSLLTIINDILDFSRIEAGKLHVEPITFDLGELLVEVMATFTANAEAKGIELILDMDGNIPSRIVTDPVRLRQILTNLIGNALKFTEKGEVVVSIALECVNDQQRLRVCIKDTGIGIAEAQLSRLFESFTQSDASTTRIYGGTGLGLAICKHLCSLMGGAITATSQAGIGSSFEFWVPVEVMLDADDDDFISTTISAKRILLVDDNQTSLAVYRTQLERANAKVTAVSTPVLALSLLTATETPAFDLVILDFPFADMPGLTLAQTIRHLPSAQHLAILVLTSALGEMDDDAFTTSGVTAHLHKPILPTTFYRAVACTLNMPEGPCSDDSWVAESTFASELALSPTLTRRKVLLVEDNVTNQEVASMTLEELGYDFDIANNGQEAVDAVMRSFEQRGRTYDVILMDCQMPVMDGYEAARRIREVTHQHYLPIIAMTANVMPGDRERCVASGMDDFIGKPILFEVVEQKLALWTASGETPRPMPQSVAPANNITSQNLVCWDVESLRRLVRDKEERMSRLLVPFVASLNQVQEEILLALTEQDLIAAKKHIHGLKGTSANLGARALPDFLQQLEVHILEGDAATAIDLATAHLAQHIQNLATAMTQYLESR